jgi:hypothetical protein
MVTALPSLFLAITSGSEGLSPSWSEGIKICIADLLKLVCWVLLLAWAAVLLVRAAEQGGDDSVVPVPVGSGPLNEDAVHLPLPEGGDDSSGNA